MSKQVVLITGALSGIGRATAIAFAHEDAQIVVSGRREEEGRKLAAELHSLGKEAEFIRADVRQEDDVRNLVDMTVAKFGRIDTAVNNAGTEGVHGPVIDQTAESYAAIFDTNVLGVLLSMKHQMRVMQAQGSGNIINISSAFGKIGGANASVYVASKHAVEGLTKSAALEAAPYGVRVNAVAPGPVQTTHGDPDRIPIPFSRGLPKNLPLNERFSMPTLFDPIKVGEQVQEQVMKAVGYKEKGSIDREDSL